MRALPGTDILLLDGPVLIEDVMNNPMLAQHPLALDRPHGRWLAIVPARVLGTEARIILIRESSPAALPLVWIAN